MKVKKDKTMAEVEEKFWANAEKKNFESYFTNHSDFRMICKNNKAIVHDSTNGFGLYYGLEGTMSEFRELAKSKKCEEKTSFTQQILHGKKESWDEE